MKTKFNKGVLMSEKPRGRREQVSILPFSSASLTKATLSVIVGMGLRFSC